MVVRIKHVFLFICFVFCSFWLSVKYVIIVALSVSVG